MNHYLRRRIARHKAGASRRPASFGDFKINFSVTSNDAVMRQIRGCLQGYHNKRSGI